MLVNDPNDSVREGDIITMTPERHSKHVLHTVSAILAPFGIPLSERPPLLTQEEREQVYLQKRLRKLERRHQRELEAQELKAQSKGREAVTRGKDSGLKDRGNPTQEVLQQEEHGRTVLPGGLHKFGKINEEAQKGKRRAEGLNEKVVENQVRRHDVEAQDGTERAKEALKNS